MKATRRAIAVMVTALALAVAVLGGAAPAGAATSYGPNHSVLFYRNGIGVTGELRNGQFSQVATYSMDGFTHAAVSRDTVLLYNRTTGWAVTSYLVGGIYYPSLARTVYLGTGWSHVAASCDTYLLYRASSGAAQTGLLEDGVLTPKANYGFSYGWNLIAASCNTVQFEMHNSQGNGWEAAGLLRGGYFHQTQANQFGGKRIMSNLAATADSFTTYSRSDLWGNWGVQNDGSVYATGATGGYSAWDVVAGTTDTALFYNRSSGYTATGTIRGGVYTYRGAMWLSSGWQVIAGGK